MTKKLVKVVSADAENEIIDLEDRQIVRANLDKHRALVESAAADFRSKVSWLRVKDGFRRNEK